ncbi:DUF4315 family protein [Butyrivibrio sp. INlla14]|uniref:DUF4315 family protein n=1 Tax=Butyrivibrio sp. INlla14 TaxID=1520808 RepID=UPI000876A583|nr:DUF4315 family protein [Butyrivibrio sp. INlla14]SCY63173.1 protein of unknown function [Butyrivibrio sp. INlla14]
MYEKLDKQRAEVERLRLRVEEDKTKLRQAEGKLKEMENAQILSDVSAFNLSPEDLGKILQQLQAGPVAVPGIKPVEPEVVDFDSEKEDEEDFDNEDE